MNRILIEISTENDAFRDGSGELSRILAALANDISFFGARNKLLKDINGNSVGEVMTDHSPIFT